tara:strand:- start:126 stop:824 length:699 start_codon:yes stop_codon:yes gene_type:complete
MALPQLNSVPKYTLTIPSTGKKVKYRPYLVKEEKILLMASEQQDPGQIMSAVVDTVIACIDGSIKKDDLKTFDIEYMFLQIRSKSVGDKIDLKLDCSECKTPNKNSIDISEIKCEKTASTSIIELTDDISVEMDYPNYTMLDFDGDSRTQGFSVLGKCIKTIITDNGENRIDASEESEESMGSFIDSMTQSQFSKLSDYLENMPAVKHTIEFECSDCGHANKLKLEGMQSFF